MSFLLTEEQEQIRESAQRALSEAFRSEPLKQLLETAGRFDTAFWQTCRDMGWTALSIPTTYEGLGLGLIELALVAEATGKAICGAPFLFTSYAAAEAILSSDNAELKAKYLPMLARGEKIGTVAFGSGADAVSPRPSLHLSNGLLTGTAEAVIAGAQADLAVLLVRDGADTALVLVDLDDSVKRDVLHTYDNSRAVADLTFTATPARPLVTRGASEAAWSVLDRAAVVLGAEQVGGADMCLDLACDYARTRHAFGQPIGKFQAIKHKLAEIYVANQVARANVLEAALRHDRDLPGFTALAAAARISASKAYDLASREGTQVFGGIGVTWEADTHLHLRRARSTAGAIGSKFVWQDRLVAAMEQAL